MKLLSILIPSYHYPDGVQNILNSLLITPSDQLEIIIGDDSTDDSVENIVSDIQLDHAGLVNYIHHSPPLGAVNNWNSLLNKASGKYILLMHHDEFPLGKDWINKLLLQLQSNDCPDIILMPCLLFSVFNKRVRIHLPQFIQILTLRYIPSYLFRRNVIGPVSCLVIRRKIYPRFDKQLQWLVDVDLFYRLFSQGASFEISKNLRVASLYDRVNSITVSLSDGISHLQKVETTYLNQKYPQGLIWLTPEAHRRIFLIETFLWGVFRVIYMVYSAALNELKQILK